MTIFGTYLNSIRVNSTLSIAEVSRSTGIHSTLYSRYESGKRTPSKKHLELITAKFSKESKQLEALWLSDKIVELSKGYSSANEALALAEERIKYLRNTKNSWRNHTINSDVQALLDEADLLKVQWQKKHPLGVSQLQRMLEYFTTEYTFESNRIEGNTLTLKETFLVVDQGLTIGGKSMIEHLEAINHSDAIEFVYGLIEDKTPLTPRVVYQLHQLILRGIDPENAGSHRKVQVKIGGSKHDPPQPFELDILMEKYFRHYSDYKSSIHPILMAADLHELLVTIHPFIDGNGRTSRLVMNLLLLQNGFTIANLKGDGPSRIRYYEALEKVQVDNDSNPFYQLIAQECVSSLKAHLALC